MSSSGQQRHLHLHPASENTSPRVKPKPVSGPGKIPVPFSYIPSDDGTDENLLILLHGLGDTHLPFANLGKQLKLPQTAVLALRAPDPVPLLDPADNAYQWYDSFDLLGEVLSNPNPTPAIGLLANVVTYLVKECKWPLHSIHLFGFAQGGSAAAEFGLWWWKEKQLLSMVSGKWDDTTPPSTAPPTPSSLGSIVAIGGPLLSFPSSLSSPSPTPVLAVHRSPPSELNLKTSDLAAFKKGYRIVEEENYKGADGGMPKSREEWEPIMRFWSERLGRRVGGAGLHEVLTGA